MKPRRHDEKQLRKRELLIAMGKKKFIWRQGVLGWGVPTTVLYNVLMYLWDYGMTTDELASGAFRTRASMSLILFPAGGVLFGWLMWKSLAKTDG